MRRRGKPSPPPRPCLNAQSMRGLAAAIAAADFSTATTLARLQGRSDGAAAGCSPPSFVQSNQRVAVPHLVAALHLHLALLASAALDVARQERVAAAAAALVRKLPPGAPLTIPWQPLLVALERVHFRKSTSPFQIGPSALRAHANALVALIRRASKFFPPPTVDELFETLRPFLAAGHVNRFVSQTILQLFLPSRGAITPPHVELLVKLWKSVDRCRDWDVNVAWPLAKAVAHSGGGLIAAVEPHLPFIFNKLRALFQMQPDAVTLLSLPEECAPFAATRGSKSHRLFYSYAKLIVAAMSPAHPRAATLLKDLLVFLQPFAHPSREGKHTPALAHFLADISRAFALRIRAEAKGEFPLEHRLRGEDVREFGEGVGSILTTAVFAKNSTMITESLTAAKFVAAIAPTHTLPLLLARVVEGLESTTKPHMMQSGRGGVSHEYTSPAPLVLFCYPPATFDPPHPQRWGCSTPSCPPSSTSGPRAHTPPPLQSKTSSAHSFLVPPPPPPDQSGVDINDPFKSVASLRLLIHIFALVPLRPARLPDGGVVLPLEFLTDWAFELVDRVFLVLEHIPGKSLSDGAEAKRVAQASRTVLDYARRLYDVAFAQMHPPLFDDVLALLLRRVIAPPPLRHLTPQVTSGQSSAPASHVAELLSAAVAAHPHRAYPPVAAALLAALLEEGLSPSEFFNYLTLLCATVRNSAGASERDCAALQDVALKAMSHKENRIAKGGAKLVRALVLSLTSVTQIKSLSSLPPKQTPPRDQIPPIAAIWGRFFSIADAALEFHTPPPSASAAAKGVVAWGLATCARWLDEVGEGSSNERLFVICRLLRDVTHAGATALFPAATVEERGGVISYGAPLVCLFLTPPPSWRQ